jgi:RNA polymerase sigma-70 factor (ECF subfamily)
VSIEQGAGGDEATSAIEIADESRRVDQRLLDGWMDARLRAALKELPAVYRTVLVMREIEGLSTKEVASITRVSEANVKTRVHRARLMLRRRLEHV